MITAGEKEQHLNQRARVIWLTGLPCSGKTTLAYRLEEELFHRGFKVFVLDGDVLRCGLNRGLDFSAAGRTENIRRIAEVSSLFNQAGIITINAFVSPTREIREMAREIIGAERFIEVYLQSDPAVCEQRDVKGMYRKARAGLIPDFTGVTAPYEIPGNPDIIVPTDSLDVEDSVGSLLAAVLPRISAE